MKIPRRQYNDLYGPTAGDRIRLADTDLLVEITRDLTVPAKKPSSAAARSFVTAWGNRRRLRAPRWLGPVITNAIILDWWGVVKADIGIRDGRIVGIGKAGEFRSMDGVTKAWRSGLAPRCYRLRKNHHRRRDRYAYPFICPQIITEALANGPHHADQRQDGPQPPDECDDLHPWPMEHSSHAGGGGWVPDQFGVPGRGMSLPEGLNEQVRSRGDRPEAARGLGTTPAAIDTCLSVAERYDIQVAIHTDTINEAGFVEDTIKAFKGPDDPFIPYGRRRRRTCAGHH